MGTRRLILRERDSLREWPLELDGCRYFFRGESTEFDSEEQAQSCFETLVKLRRRKGDLVLSDSAWDANNQLHPSTFGSGVADPEALVQSFAGKEVRDYDEREGPAPDGKIIYRFGSDWNDKDRFYRTWAHFSESGGPSEATGLVTGFLIGAPFIRNLVWKATFPKVVALFLGDIHNSVVPTSSIQHDDLSPLFAGFPNLEMFRLRGTQHMEFGKFEHGKLRGLVIESTQLSPEILHSILGCSFPKLEHLELWLGGDRSRHREILVVEDLVPLFKGELFPNLKYLGLRNCHFVDDIAGVIVNTPLVKRLETLDFSLGTLSDVGAQALLSLKEESPLIEINAEHNWVSGPMMKKLRALPFFMNLSDAHFRGVFESRDRRAERRVKVWK